MNNFCEKYTDLIKSIAVITPTKTRYLETYIAICTKACERGMNKKEAKKKFGYIEGHHIVPKSFGLVAPNIRENQVFLTAKEHFICHRLLVKITDGKFRQKMWNALFTMCFSNGKHKRRIISSRQYEYIREHAFGEEFSKKMSKQMTALFIGTKYFNNGKVTVRAKECPDGFVLGRADINRIEKNWFTNGIENKQALNCPDGFWSGRTMNSSVGTTCYTNGIENRFLKECPTEEGWHEGQTRKKSRKGLKCWTNGTEDVFSNICPEGFYHGQKAKPKQEKQWFNNGVKNIKRAECPVGFYPGKIDFGRPKIIKLTRESFISRAKPIQWDKNHMEYDYSLVTEDIRYDTLVDIICPKHKIIFSQIPKHHMRGHGCPNCGTEKATRKTTKTTETFIEQGIKKYNGFFLYPRTVYVNAHTKVIITCPICGDFKQKPNNHLSGFIGCHGNHPQIQKSATI